MLDIKDLSVSIEGKEVIRDLSLSVGPGQVHAIMCPNGAGKSSLAMALAGHPSYKISGSVKVEGKEISGLPPDERARSGLFLGFQSPAEVEGVKVGRFIRKSVLSGEVTDPDRMLAVQESLEKDAESLGLGKAYLSRDLNVGFSGGERKRLEVLQLLALKPKAAVLDEVDSGLDVDGIKAISEAINKMRTSERCFLLITHYPRILKHIRPDKVHILSKGKLVRSGPQSLAHEIEEKGYAAMLGGPDA